MKMLKLSLLLASLSLTAACGAGSPRYYMVAIDRSPAEALPATCYRGGTAPQATDKSTSVITAQQWVVWDGPDNTLYLGVGDMSVFDLGDAQNVRINGSAIAGKMPTFTETREQVTLGATVTTSVTVNLTDLSNTLKGTLTLDSKTACTNCGIPACNVALPITGHRFDANPEMNYVP
jgi:hypothetical protein